MTEIIQVIANVASVIVAIGALVAAFCIEKRNQLRFNDQLKQSEKIALANIKPLLSMKSQKYVDLKSICVNNYGVGPSNLGHVTLTCGFPFSLE